MSSTASAASVVAQSNSTEEIVAALRARSSFMFVSHVKPDGDTLGAGLALGLALKALGKRVGYFQQDPVPRNLRFLPDADSVARAVPADLPADTLWVFCDMSDFSRAGEFLPKLDLANMLDLDNHLGNSHFGALNYVIPTEASTGTCVLRLLKALDATITPEIATCILTTIMTDTGAFMHTNTTAAVLRMSAEMIELGADKPLITEEIFANKRFAATKLLGMALDRAQMLHDLLGILTVGIARAQHRFIDVRPAIAALVLQHRAFERHPEQLRRREQLVRKDLLGDQRLVGPELDHLRRHPQHGRRRVRMHEGAGIGHDRRQNARRDLRRDRRIERLEQPQHARPGRRLGRNHIVERAEVRVPQMVIDVEHVRPVELRQELPRPREVTHVAEHPERIGGKVGRHRTRDGIRIRQEPQIPRHRILLKITDPLPQRLQRQPQRKPRPERIPVGLHVRNEHERGPRAQCRNDLLGRIRLRNDARGARRTTHRSPSHAPASCAALWRAPSSDPRRTSARAYTANRSHAPAPRAGSAKHFPTRPSTAAPRAGPR